MSKSGLFAHFGSKQELQLATVDAAARRFRAAVIEPALQAPPTACRACGRWPTPTLRTSTAAPTRAAASGPRPRPSTTTGPARCATRSPPRSTPGSASSSARRGSPASAEPGRFAFELYAVVMGANSRFRLGGDRVVFGYARAAVERLLASCPA